MTHDCTVLVLAGGSGLRLGGLGRLVPKALLVAYDKPLLVRSLHQLARHGFREVLVSTSPLFYEMVAEAIRAYESGPSAGLEGRVRVLNNRSHERGPLPALHEALEQVVTRRTLLHLGDEFNQGDPYSGLTDRLADEADHLVGTQPDSRAELTAGGLLHLDAEGSLIAIVEARDPNPPADALRWTGNVLFDTVSGRADLSSYLHETTGAPGPLGDFFEYRRRKGCVVRALRAEGAVNINVNTVDHLLRASLYAACEGHAGTAEVAAALRAAALALGALSAAP